eukprot:CAMPEP_0181348186 /NCGR_PEP_ID=MMETSP1106-20121128/39_1 /TAXON_ID=81844 /ORGANISM="Mantoniella antarctica, Strain SL-175" /LENGTH=96 /DNA_ID=CAMNT_0023460457 /DNA_START=253 /DNA_END=543 /DNA_ORIENTATION=+
MDVSTSSVAAWCQENKLRAIGGVWVSGLAASMAYNATKPGMKTSVKVIHSRLYAQALTLTCLLGSAAAEAYDRKYGSAKDPPDDPFIYKAPTHVVK